MGNMYWRNILVCGRITNNRRCTFLDIGTGIKKLRKSFNLNQEKFATKVGISQTYVSDLENNRKNPTVNTMNQILEPFNISYVDFLIDYCGYKRAGAPEGEAASEGRARLDKAEIEWQKQERQDEKDELEHNIALSKLIPLEDGLENGFSLNEDPIEPHEQKVLNAFIESMILTREKQIDMYRQGIAQGRKDKE